MKAAIQTVALMAMLALLAGSQCYARCLTLACQDRAEHTAPCHGGHHSNSNHGPECGQNQIASKSLEAVRTLGPQVSTAAWAVCLTSFDRTCSDRFAPADAGSPPGCRCGMNRPVLRI